MRSLFQIFRSKSPESDFIWALGIFVWMVCIGEWEKFVVYTRFVFYKNVAVCKRFFFLKFRNFSVIPTMFSTRWEAPVNLLLLSIAHLHVISPCIINSIVRSIRSMSQRSKFYRTVVSKCLYTMRNLCCMFYSLYREYELKILRISVKLAYLGIYLTEKHVRQWLTWLRVLLRFSDGNFKNFFISIFIDIVFFIYTRRKNAKSEANIVFLVYALEGLTNKILFWKIFAVFSVLDKTLKRPGHIFENASNISRISSGFLHNFAMKLFEVSIILCKFFQKSPWKFHKISIKMIFKSLYKLFPIFFHNFY